MKALRVRVDERALQKARRALRVETDAEAVRLSLERVAEMETFWQFMARSQAKLKPGEIAPPE